MRRAAERSGPLAVRKVTGPRRSESLRASTSRLSTVERSTAVEGRFGGVILRSGRAHEGRWQNFHLKRLSSPKKASGPPSPARSQSSPARSQWEPRSKPVQPRSMCALPIYLVDPERVLHILPDIEAFEAYCDARNLKKSNMKELLGIFAAGARAPRPRSSTATGCSAVLSGWPTASPTTRSLCSARLRICSRHCRMNTQ